MARRDPTLAIVLAIVVSAGFLVASIARKYAAKVHGRVTAEAASFGSVAFDVTHCVAGPAPVAGSFGVDLRGERGVALRLVDSGRGAELWLFPSEAITSFDPIGRDHCQEWDVAVERTDKPGDSERVVSGHVRVACRIGGGHLEADVTFEGCRL